MQEYHHSAQVGLRDRARRHEEDQRPQGQQQQDVEGAQCLLGTRAAPAVQPRPPHEHRDGRDRRVPGRRQGVLPTEVGEHLADGVEGDRDHEGDAAEETEPVLQQTSLEGLGSARGSGRSLRPQHLRGHRASIASGRLGASTGGHGGGAGGSAGGFSASTPLRVVSGGPCQANLNRSGKTITTSAAHAA